MAKAAKLKPFHLEMLVKAAEKLVEACTNYNLDCRDPPLATTRLLYSMGYSQYLIRSMWKALQSSPGTPVLYKYRNATFNLMVKTSIEAVCSISYNGLIIPLDAMDAIKIKRGGHLCHFTPRSHTVRIYLNGNVLEHVEIRINIIRLLTLMARDYGLERTFSLLDSLTNVIWRRGSGELESFLLEALHNEGYRRILSFILPYVPKTPEEIYKVSPALRRIKAYFHA